MANEIVDTEILRLASVSGYITENHPRFCVPVLLEIRSIPDAIDNCKHSRRCKRHENTVPHVPQVIDPLTWPCNKCSRGAWTSIDILSHHHKKRHHRQWQKGLTAIRVPFHHLQLQRKLTRLRAKHAYSRPSVYKCELGTVMVSKTSTLVNNSIRLANGVQNVTKGTECLRCKRFCRNISVHFLFATIWSEECFTMQAAHQG